MVGIQTDFNKKRLKLIRDIDYFAIKRKEAKKQYEFLRLTFNQNSTKAEWDEILVFLKKVFLYDRKIKRFEYRLRTLEQKYNKMKIRPAAICRSI